MRLPKFLRPRKTEPSAPALQGLPTGGLLAARNQMQENIRTGRDPASIMLTICSMRSYVFQSILNGRVCEAEAIRDSLEEVDMLIPSQKLRLATLQTEFPGRTVPPTPFEKLSLTIDELASCINAQRYADGNPRILAHLTDGQSDDVCLMPLLEDEVLAAYFVDYLRRVNAQLQSRHGWRFTACISEEFSDLTQLAQVYFHTRHIHEMLVDAKAGGEVWLAEEQAPQWEAKPVVPETVWWVEPMRQYVMQNYANPDMNITFLAREFGISSAYVGRKFRETTGIGLLELIHRCRLTELERRTAGGESIRDAAAAVGYTSLLTMQRARERYQHE